jgi:tRNA-2-methylthio-N6-dimethylallyladenosine synthase
VYSDRPNAPAAQFKNKVSERQKRKRLKTLLDLQENFTKTKNQLLVGSTQPILVEGISKKQSSGTLDEVHSTVQWTGRTSTNKIVNFHNGANPQEGADIFPGKIVRTRIERAYAHSLWGKPLGVESPAGGMKGEESYAA